MSLLLLRLGTLMDKHSRSSRNARFRAAKPCFVYAIGCDRGSKGYGMKVGISDNVPFRLSTLQVGSCEELKLHFSFKLPAKWMALWVERSFHQSFSHRHIRGEWFSMPPEGAIALIAGFVVRVLSSEGGNQAALRRGAGLLECFALLDQMSTPDEQAVWDGQFDEHAVSA